MEPVWSDLSRQLQWHLQLGIIDIMGQVKAIGTRTNRVLEGYVDCSDHIYHRFLFTGAFVYLDGAPA